MRGVARHGGLPVAGSTGLLAMVIHRRENSGDWQPHYPGWLSLGKKIPVEKGNGKAGAEVRIRLAVAA